MGTAHICKCGHTKSDHKYRKRLESFVAFQCEWYDCECKAFLLKEMVTYGRTPSLYHKPSKLIINHSRESFIGELRDNGTVIRQ